MNVVEFVIAEVKKLGGICYVASPYSKYKMGLNAAAYDVADVTAKLMRHGICALSPIIHGHEVTRIGRLDALDQEFWKAIDKPFVDAASACVVVLMDGWRESAGVQHEIEEFTKAGKPIFYLDPKDLNEARAA